MSDIEKQKEIFSDEVLHLQKLLNGFNFIFEKVEKNVEPDVRIAIGIFDELFVLLFRLLGESIILNLSWLLDKRGHRSIYWYLNQLDLSDRHVKEKVEAARIQLDSIEAESQKVKRFRDKWIAHKDKEAFANPEKFWKEEGRLLLEEANKLVQIVMDIIQIECDFVDHTSSGIHKLFFLSKEVLLRDSMLLYKMHNIGILEMDYQELQLICQQQKKSQVGM